MSRTGTAKQKRRDEAVQSWHSSSNPTMKLPNDWECKRVKTKTIAQKQFDAAQTNIFELFQYMIANTDWAIKKGPGTEVLLSQCEKSLGVPDAEDNWIVLPYDFDQAGHHRTRNMRCPQSGLPIRNGASHRLYRGRCRTMLSGPNHTMCSMSREDIERETPEALRNRLGSPR